MGVENNWIDGKRMLIGFNRMLIEEEREKDWRNESKREVMERIKIKSEIDVINGVGIIFLKEIESWEEVKRLRIIRVEGDGIIKKIDRGRVEVLKNGIVGKLNKKIESGDEWLRKENIDMGGNEERIGLIWSVEKIGKEIVKKLLRSMGRR